MTHNEVNHALWRTSLERIQQRFAEAARHHGRLACLLIQSRIPRYGFPDITENELPSTEATNRLRLVGTGRGLSRELNIRPPTSPSEIPAKPVLDTTGKPIVNSAGDPCVVEYGFSRNLRYFGDSLGEYNAIAGDAGQCLAGLPLGVKGILWHEWHDGFWPPTDESLWTSAVFELAWQKHSGSPLSADKFAWFGSTSFELEELPRLRQFPGVQIDIPDPPVHWYSVLDDLLNASVAAVDTLLSLGRTVTEQTPPQSKSAQVTSPDTPDEAAEEIDRAAVLASLQPAERKAYLSYEFVESKAGRQLEDRGAYELLRVEGLPGDAGDLGELEDYELPRNFDTWRRYLRTARKALDESKYTRRAGRPTGRSVVRRNEI